MPTLDNYLTVPAAANVGVWVQLVSNTTFIAYVSTAPTDGTGRFRVTAPADIYTVSIGPTNVGPWTPTGDQGFAFGSAQGALGINWRGAWNGAAAFVIGDIVTQGGGTYFCTAGNTNQQPPNASYWGVIDSGPPAELGYVEQTTSPFTTSNVLADVPSMTLAITVGTRKVKFEIGGYMSINASAGYLYVVLLDTTGGGSTEIMRAYCDQAGHNTPVYVARETSPAAGARTYKLQYAVQVNTFVGQLIDFNGDNPFYLRAIEV